MRRKALVVVLVFALLVLLMQGLKGLQRPSETDAQPSEGRILFFQGSAHCDECQIQADELAKLKERMPELEILEYDVDKDRLVANRYNVWIVPTLIVDGRKYEGMVTVDHLESIIATDPDQAPQMWGRFLDSLPLGFSLAAGLLTGLEPCALAFSGMVVLFIMGSTAADAERRLGSVVAASVFTVTRASVFAVFGFAVTALGASAGDLRFALLIAASATAFFVGCSYLGLIQLPLTTLAPSSKTLLKLRKGHLTPILLGLVFGFAVLPCATPVMASLLAFVAGTRRIATGMASLFLFGAGLSTPVIAFTLLGKTYWQRSQWILKQGGKLSIALGASLVALSLYLLYAAF